MPVIPPATPGPTAAELATQRLLTNQFIAANPSVLTLIPRERVKTGSGVKWDDQDPRPVQVGRLIDLSGTATLVTADGRQRQQTFQLLLPWDGEVGLYDYWNDSEGIRHEVSDLLPDNGYERRATVVRYAE